MEGRELKLHRLTADKKLQKVRWLPLSETGQKSDSMFGTVMRTALFCTILFTLFWTEFFQYLDAFKNWGGGVNLKRSHNKITGQAYVLSLLFLHYCFYHYCFYHYKITGQAYVLSLLFLRYRQAA